MPAAPKSSSKFVIDASAPVADQIFDLLAFERFLRDKIKVSNRTNNLAEGGITITRDGSTKIIFTSTEIAVAKRYLKYLSKKFLKKHQLKEYLRVVATDKSTYTIKYFKVGDEEEEADE